MMSEMEFSGRKAADYRAFDIDPSSPSVAGRSQNARHGKNHYIQGFCA
jgi:hypothetical protein